MNEFDLIRRYFQSSTQDRDDVVLGIGDDGAILSVPDGHQLVVSTDTLVAGTHFLTTMPPQWIGHKTLAANLSDMAAMGAKPCWISLALTLPDANVAWLSAFCEGFFALAAKHNVALIGGDTTKGPLSITVTIHGVVPNGKAVRRSGAQVGDDIYVTGTLGDSDAGLSCVLSHPPFLPETEHRLWCEKHHCRTPRVDFALNARSYMTSALDISDGVVSDLGHILASSHVGANIEVSRLPLSEDLLSFDENQETAQKRALRSGEEYELCFTADVRSRSHLMDLAKEHKMPLTCIGTITDEPSILRLMADKTPLNWQLHGFDHFKEPNHGGS